MKKILSWTAVGIMSIGALAACGSDKKSPTTTKAPAVTTGDTAAGDSTATTAGSSGDSSAVDEFCAKVTDLVAKGPTASDYATKLQELITSSQSLAAQAAADPTVQAKLEDCLKKLQPGG